jgi:hypothetical protein
MLVRTKSLTLQKETVTKEKKKENVYTRRTPLPLSTIHCPILLSLPLPSAHL